MIRRLQHGLSKRERQIVEAIYSMKRASVEEVLDAIPEPPSYSAVRATLNILVRKGMLVHKKDGRKYLYSPVIPAERARQSAVKQLLHTYFDNSVHEAVSALIRVDRRKLSDRDYTELLHLIKSARKNGAD